MKVMLTKDLILGFLKWCVDVVCARGNSAEGHFRHAGVTIEEM